MSKAFERTRNTETGLWLSHVIGSSLLCKGMTFAIFNFEFDRNIVSGTGSRAEAIVVPFLSEFSCISLPWKLVHSVSVLCHYHDDIIKWKHFPRYWPFVRGIHRLPVNSSPKGQWRGALMFFIFTWTNRWANNWDTGDLRRHRAHYKVIVMLTVWFGSAVGHRSLFCGAIWNSWSTTYVISNLWNPATLQQSLVSMFSI